ncbi:P22 coat protein-gene protein 5 [Desulfotomaculum arcticum]|uniref:P22 coat protein-gene protein 5 n=1 Tax=Desulfotruncus arcticus DSM 17038 TaxID=1121424 RepID=A0A1I2VT94_9FIRM|nr:P22 phage major capsid protein family protein [Desulfotruncus arcticus]SFG92352.1 P22 coat protein-gene protein 5 [Desulfotomaculum arcticum] [Desulfotruncus arcticus DSM 17038]
MGNTFLTPSIIAKEAMMQLKNNTVMANLVHRDYSNEFVAGVGNTITIRKPATFEAKEFDSTAGIQIQDATEGSETVVLDKLLDVSFEVTAEQLTLDIQNFSEQLLTPAMQSFANKIDQYLLGLYIDVPDYYGTAGTTPSAVGDITNTRMILNVNKAPFENRNLVIDPINENSFLQIAGFYEADKVGDNGTALREASLGRKFGFDIFTDQNVQTHTKGTLTADAGTLKVKGAVSANSTQFIIDGTNLTGTLVKGDLLTISGNNYVATEDATAAAGEIAVKVFPATAEIADNADVTIIDNHTASLAFHKNAFALVTRPLALPKGLSSEQKAIINYDGFGLRVIYDYNSQYKKDVVSIDMLCGVKTLNPKLDCRLLG